MKQLPKYPTITVVITTVNSEGTIGQCLESIRNQDYPQGKIDIILVKHFLDADKAGG